MIILNHHIEEKDIPLSIRIERPVCIVAKSVRSSFSRVFSSLRLRRERYRCIISLARIAPTASVLFLCFELMSITSVSWPFSATNFV